MSLLKAVLFTVVVSTVAFVAYQLDEHVHSERWRVKTLGDSLALVLPATPSTIDEQAAMPAPDVGESVARQPGERTLYSIHADLVEVKKEFDDDYHLIIEDPLTHSRMIAEIPDGDNLAPASYRQEYLVARKTIDSLAGKPGVFAHELKRPIPITLTGVGFFDEAHLIPQEGRSANNREIHPVLSIRPDLESVSAAR